MADDNIDKRPEANEEERERTAALRMEKLRNLSFGISPRDPSNEFSEVPAYVRRNMNLPEDADEAGTTENEKELKEIVGSISPSEEKNPEEEEARETIIMNWEGVYVPGGNTDDIKGPSQRRALKLPIEQSSNNHLSLYFSLIEFEEDEIVEIISLLSDVYKSVGGDELEIKSIKTFEFATQPTTELV